MKKDNKIVCFFIKLSVIFSEIHLKINSIKMIKKMIRSNNRKIKKR